MNRRAYLLAVTGGAAGLAGCSITDSEEAPLDTPTQTDGGETAGNESDSSAVDVESGSQSDEEPEADVIPVQDATPTAAVETFYMALYAPDADTVNEMFHSESPSARYTESTVARFQDYSYEIIDIEVVEQSRGEASAEVQLAIDDPDRGRRENTVDVTLRTEDGNWRIWSG